jgi:hypothetical protein
MKAANLLSTAVLVGLSLASLAWGANAQSRRDAAMERCIAQAQAQFPFSGDLSNQQSRTASYKACMRAAGQRP